MDNGPDDETDDYTFSIDFYEHQSDGIIGPTRNTFAIKNQNKHTKIREICFSLLWVKLHRQFGAHESRLNKIMFCSILSQICKQVFRFKKARNFPSLKEA